MGDGARYNQSEGFADAEASVVSTYLYELTDNGRWPVQRNDHLRNSRLQRKCHNSVRLPAMIARDLSHNST